MEKIKVLFVCVHNSARSQMAMAYLKSLGAEEYVADSAGLEPGSLNSMVVKAMADDGIDISQNKPKKVFDLIRAGREFDTVVTVCDGVNGEKCPIFPGKVTRIHKEFTDPSSFSGTDEEVYAKTISVRNEIKEWVKKFIANGGNYR